MSEKELNKTMKELLGFPDFYGMNWDAMIDCLSYMRYPHEQMTELTDLLNSYLSMKRIGSRIR